MKKALSTILSLTLLVFVLPPVSVKAQEAASTTESTAQVPISAPLTSTSGSGVQQSIESGLLEEAANPQSDPLQEAIKVIDAAAADDEGEGTTVTGEETETIEVPPADTEVVETLAPETEKVAELDMETLVPTKEFTFEIAGTQIATKETPEWSDDDAGSIGSAENVTTAPDLSIDTHTLNISGSCTDPYYVILIYRNAGDYNRDPASYIFNRAFFCEGGRYSYALADLPFNLESGTFYLLVGGQGPKGSWKPISALTPIGITVKTVMVEASSTSNEQ